MQKLPEEQRQMFFRGLAKQWFIKDAMTKSLKS